MIQRRFLTAERDGQVDASTLLINAPSDLFEEIHQQALMCVSCETTVYLAQCYFIVIR